MWKSGAVMRFIPGSSISLSKTLLLSFKRKMELWDLLLSLKRKMEPWASPFTVHFDRVRYIVPVLPARPARPNVRCFLFRIILVHHRECHVEGKFR